MNLRDKFRGCMIGLAMGDALGAPYEFMKPPFEQADSFAPGVFGTRPGHPTDDTQLAICLARSIIDWGEFVPGDYARRLLDWAESNPPDIGVQTAIAARHYADHLTGPPETDSAGNGSLMAIAPLALLTSNTGSTRRQQAVRFANITHPNDDARTINIKFCDAIAAALQDETIEVDERPCPDPAGEQMGWCRLTYALATETLTATKSPQDAIGALRNLIALGGDTDTNAAVAGGACQGLVAGFFRVLFVCRVC